MLRMPTATGGEHTHGDKRAAPRRGQGLESSRCRSHRVTTSQRHHLAFDHSKKHTEVICWSNSGVFQAKKKTNHCLAHAGLKTDSTECIPPPLPSSYSHCRFCTPILGCKGGKARALLGFCPLCSLLFLLEIQTSITWLCWLMMNPGVLLTRPVTLQQF